ncbi:MerR family transcriptional regulator [Hydrogenoanaerobacterium sp.]|uniref:MerR family transcriptional regulator n=1 Tax=Hydrogenoanaerobacterium sp. TaxID=2953763 RepID=UPI00289B1121|nr:MerR family transcriptional regulator [Hydrogenoanaerobacterium sp.]
MFRIGIFSKLVRVSARMLRHYEKCGLLYPAEIDHVTGYRFFSMKQISLLNKIVDLRDMGFSIEEIGDILPNYDNARYLEKALKKKAKEIQATIAAEQARLEKLMDMRFQLRGDKPMVYDVELKALPEIKVISLKEVIADYSDEEHVWEKMFQFIIENNIPICKGEGAYSDYLDDEYKESDVEIEISLPVNELGNNNSDGFVFQTLKAIPHAATIKFSGSYENYSSAMERLGIWIEENGYEVVGNVRGIALHDLLITTNPNDFLTELQIPVGRTGE